MRVAYQYTLGPPRPRGIRFGRTELRDIGMAVGALTLAFMMMWLSPFSSGSGSVTTLNPAIALLFSFIAVVTGFLMHELAHKIVAMRYGMWAEFRADQRGLLLAVVTGLFGIVLAAPGAVVIFGGVNKKENAVISMAGPLTNLGFGGGFFGLLLALSAFYPTLNYLAFWLVLQIVLVNLMLGTFNMIPVPPLDGSKIFRWKLPVWGAMFVTFVILLAVFYVLFLV